MIKDLFDSIYKHDLVRIKELIFQQPQIINEYCGHSSLPGLGIEQSTPLIFAARLGQVDTVQFLLNQGADVNKRAIGCCEIDALTETISQQSPSLEVIKALINAGADLNSSNECLGTSALSEAAQRGHLEIVKLLLESGADVNKQVDNIESQMRTALIEATMHEHADIVKLLIKYNADPFLTDDDDETALAIAMKKGYESIAVLLNEAMQKASQ